MTIKERFNLFFYKNSCIQVIIIDVNKRLNSYLVKTDNNDFFSIGTRTYAVCYNAVYINSKGIPAYIYYYDNPSAITREDLEYEILPIDLKNIRKKPKVSSSEFFDAIDESILSKIIRYQFDGDKKIINTIMISAGVVILVNLAGMYFLYTLLDNIILFITENEDLLEVIKDALRSGVGN